MNAPPLDTRARIGLGLLFLLALVPRIVAVAQYESHHPNANSPVIDERSYDSWAREIAAGDWIGEAVFFQEPLYPYFLGAIYTLAGADDGIEAARFVQCLLGALACVLVALCARELFGSLAGWIAGGALALSEAAIMFSAYLLKPNLVMPLLALAVWLALKRVRADSNCAKTWIGLGLLAGLGALLRGNLLLLLPIFAIGTFLPTRRAKPVSLLGAGILLVLLPVVLRNYAVGDVFALTTSGAGTNLYGGNNAQNPNGVAREFDWVRGIPEYEADDWRHEAERRSGRTLDAGEVSRFWMSEVASSIASDPGLHVSILWNKLRATLSDYEVPDNHDLGWDRRYVSILRAPLLSWSWFGPLMIAGVLLGLSDPRSTCERLVALFFLAYLVTIVLTVTSMRVRLALLPLGLPLAAGFVYRLYFRRSTKAIGSHACALLLGVGIVHWSGPFDTAERTRRLDVRDYNLVTQLLDDQHSLDQARELANELRARYSQSARIQSLWAEVEAREGLRLISAPGTDEAKLKGQQKIQASLAILRTVSENTSLSSKELFRARRLAGWIQLALENGQAAANHFRIALEFDPNDSELWLGWIQASLSLLPNLDSEPRASLRAEILRRIDEQLDPGSPAAIDLKQRASSRQ